MARSSSCTNFMRSPSACLIFARDSKSSHDVAALVLYSSPDSRSCLSSSLWIASKCRSLLCRYSRFRAASRSNRRKIAEVLSVCCAMKFATVAKPFGYSAWGVVTSTSSHGCNCRRNMNMMSCNSKIPRKFVGNYRFWRWKSQRAQARSAPRRLFLKMQTSQGFS